MGYLFFYSSYTLNEHDKEEVIKSLIKEHGKVKVIEMGIEVLETTGNENHELIPQLKRLLAFEKFKIELVKHMDHSFGYCEN